MNKPTIQQAYLSGDSNLFVRTASAASKADLREFIFNRARIAGRSWIIGGPSVMSKDELVTMAVRIFNGEEFN